MKEVLIFLLCIFSFVSWADEGRGKALCPTIYMSGNGVSCYGQNNGSATVLAQFGSGNYTYTWSNGANSTTISGLAVGTYTVNVRDNVSGCTIIGAYVVSSPDPITTDETVTDVLCHGNSTGSVGITTYGGTFPYSYSWTNGSSSEDLTNVYAGSYTLSILDSRGCSYTKLFTIEEPLESLQASSIVKGAKCFGQGNGSIDLTVWGGTPSYSYAWSNGPSSQDVNGLFIGNYSALITDFNGCSLNLPFTISQPQILTSTVSSTSVLCFGESTGTATANPSGGTTPYSYSWQNSVNLFSQNSSTLINVPADNYQVTITDNNGCTFVGNTTIAQPPVLSLSATHTNVSCFGGSDGSINLTVTGGVPSYTYSWINGIGITVGSTQDISLLPASLYTVTVTDQNGCQESLTEEVTQPNAPITFDYEISDVLCFGENTGAINLIAGGGTAPLSYTWTSGQSTEDISSMLAGTYGFTIIDANNCTASGNTTISQPLAPLSVQEIITNVNCFGESNGSINLTVSGGTAAYTFDWDNSTFNLSFNGEDLINFPADYYRIEVTDANACKYIDTIEITQPDLLVASLSQNNVLCYGESTGTIDVTISGGVLPYQSLWNNGMTTEDLNSLPADSYISQISDDHNCQLSINTTITQPLDTISFSHEVFSVHCFGGSNGAIDLFVDGGTFPYTYLWSNGQTENDIDTLVSGWYEFTITDFNACQFVDSIFVSQPDQFQTHEVVTPVSCYGGSDGQINISPTGGTTPFSYIWFNSTFALADQSEDLIDYPADIYQLEVRDSNNCFYETFIEIVQPDSLWIDHQIKWVTCYGGSDGAIFVDIFGGNPGYVTNWSNGTNNEDLIDVVSDTFQLIATDTKGCLDTLIAFVPQPDSMGVVFEHDPVTCIDQHNGVGYAFPFGGNEGYSYLWSSGSVSDTATSLGNQFYILEVTDILGCTVTDSVYITKIDAPCIDPPNAFTPNGDVYNDTWQIDNLYLYPDIQILVFDKWGVKVHEQIGTYEPWNGQIHGVDAPSDTYYYVIYPNFKDREAAIGNVTILK